MSFQKAKEETKAMVQQVNKPTFCGVIHDSNIITDYGFIKISHIKIGDKVLAGENEYAEVISVDKGVYVGEMIIIRTALFTLTCTPDVRLKVLKIDSNGTREEWKRADEISMVDKFAIFSPNGNMTRNYATQITRITKRTIVYSLTLKESKQYTAKGLIIRTDK